MVLLPTRVTSFTLDHSTADNVVTVVSTGQDATTGQTGTSTLDLTNTTIAVNGNGTNHSTIQVGTGTRDQTRDADAVLLVKEDQKIS